MLGCERAGDVITTICVLGSILLMSDMNERHRHELMAVHGCTRSGARKGHLVGDLVYSTMYIVESTVPLTDSTVSKYPSDSTDLSSSLELHIYKSRECEKECF